LPEAIGYVPDLSGVLGHRDRGAAAPDAASDPREKLVGSERAARCRTAASYLLALTVTLNEAVAVLALESMAEHVTRVRPSGNRLPDRGSQVTGTGPSTASLAVTL
jgi:hypothetical protein